MKIVYNVVLTVEILCFMIALINSINGNNSVENRKIDLLCSLVFFGMIVIECFLMSFGKI